jgi:hypothetical protein
MFVMTELSSYVLFPVPELCRLYHFRVRSSRGIQISVLHRSEHIILV